MSSHVLDLRGEVCPMNFVRIKLKLEELQGGEGLEVWLDEGEPVCNVTRSVKDEGHKILKLERVNCFYRLLIEKAQPIC
ncbi:MAG: sulfurtransferase TusA family protein [Chloroflexi bacterium]|nr:sulfurtransferase TusA family protein [Chloroflexota bacterium]MBI5956706.1 sulfurtransferase TusA family protein [Chloroflexota bacterium]